LRLPVQRVIRPDQNYRGFAGQISAGTVRKGDVVLALPSGRTSRVASITTFDGDLEEASAPLSIALTLEDELDISRGDLISELERKPQHATAIEASLVWFDAERLETHRPYLVKHGAQTLPGRVTQVLYRTNIQTLAEEAVNSLGMNDVGVAELELTRPLFFDPYVENRASGSFILIDPHTNATLAAGMIRRAVATTEAGPEHKAAVVLLDGSLVAELELALLKEGAAVVRTRVTAVKTLRGLLALGLISLIEGSLEEATRESLATAGFAVVDARGLTEVSEAVEQLRAADVLDASERRLN